MSRICVSTISTRCLRNNLLLNTNSKKQPRSPWRALGPRPAGAPPPPAAGPRPKKKKKTKAELYHDEMRKLMSFLHNGRVFAPGHRWSRAQLLAITPEKIMRLRDARAAPAMAGGSRIEDRARGTGGGGRARSRVVRAAQPVAALSRGARVAQPAAAGSRGMRAAAAAAA